MVDATEQGTDVGTRSILSVSGSAVAHWMVGPEAGTLRAKYQENNRRTRVDFDLLLAAAAVIDDDAASPDAKGSPRDTRALLRRAERLKRAVSLADLVRPYTALTSSGTWLVGHCPFHSDAARSFSVDPKTGTYACVGCGAEGDVVTFLMHKESMTFGQALEALERYHYIHEL